MALGIEGSDENQSTQKSEKVTQMFMTLKGDAKSKGKLICGLKEDIRNLVNFHASSQKSENLHFDRILLSKVNKDLDENIQKSQPCDTAE